ncbi:MAG: HEPN domain-containing protein [Candidatus Cloacimonetes bacterium]|nr:HEPN domain-containing protein [Candidatus Cloacimonadota bacterium]MCF7814706.1 HEPN domain-containing protein [Candidatus Cloacimonadota bacterium]MCF7868173.1 HEPN domain-containing protein [Candidatus Cloacimonadota bacterium]MCF7884475.1 HEPN domain-containing protein [Candidatus Cloacimonadota bacterium]
MKEKTDLVNEWFHKAENDLGIVELAIKNDVAFTDVICYHCQQAAEKYLKGCLTAYEISYKKSHDIFYLLELLSDKVDILSKYFDYASTLNSYAIEMRYPDDMYEPSKEEALEAKNMAFEIKLIVVNILKR